MTDAHWPLRTKSNILLQKTLFGNFTHFYKVMIPPYFDDVQRSVIFAKMTHFFRGNVPGTTLTRFLNGGLVFRCFIPIYEGPTQNGETHVICFTRGLRARCYPNLFRTWPPFSQKGNDMCMYVEYYFWYFCKNVQFLPGRYFVGCGMFHFSSICSCFSLYQQLTYITDTYPPYVTGEGGKRMYYHVGYGQPLR